MSWLAAQLTRHAGWLPKRLFELPDGIRHPNGKNWDA
jgi:hypothetical protein